MENKTENIFKESNFKIIDILTKEIRDEIDDLKNRNLELSSQVDYYISENKKLESQVKNLKKEQTEGKESEFFKSILTNVKNIDFTNDSNTLLNFLSWFWEADYTENSYDVPLWLIALTNYYSHKNEVIEFLKILNIKLPIDIENFRLPIDWTEAEMDIFFITVYNHCNCNGCIYEKNLNFWGTSSLDSVEEQCNRHYSEIPWQFVLRNPILKKEKFLRQIGEHFADKYSNWSNFLKIDEYLSLTDDEIKTIIDNIDFVKMSWDGINKSFDNHKNFMLRHINLIQNPIFLDKIYDMFKSSYAFQYNNKILDMPAFYLEKWISEKGVYSIDWIKNNKDKFSKEEIKKLITIALTEEKA